MLLLAVDNKELHAHYLPLPITTRRSMSAAATDFEENEEEEEKEEDDDDDFDAEDEDVVEEEEDLHQWTTRVGGKRKGHIRTGDETSISQR